MKRNDLIKELENLGATFKEGAKHTKVYLNGKQTPFQDTQKSKKAQ